MNKKTITTALLAFAFALGMANQASAAGKKDTAKSSHTMTPELKGDLSEMYLKMGECMKTEKSMEQCQKDIMKDCPVMKKTGHCPLMDGMKPMTGKMHDMKDMDHSTHQ